LSILQASSTADNADFLGVGGSAAAAQAAAHLQTGAGEPSCVVQGDTADSGGSDAVEVALADLFGRDHEVIPAVKAALALRRRKRQLLKKAILLGLYYNTYLNKNPYSIAKESGIECAMKEVAITCLE